MADYTAKRQALQAQIITQVAVTREAMQDLIDLAARYRANQFAVGQANAAVDGDFTAAYPYLTASGLDGFLTIADAFSAMLAGTAVTTSGYGAKIEVIRQP